MSVREKEPRFDDAYLKERRSAGESAWVLDRRESGLKEAARLPLPDFRKTRVQPLRLDEIRPGMEGPLDGLAPQSAAAADAHLVVGPAGAKRTGRGEALRDKGILLMGLDEAIAEVPDKVEPYLFKRPEAAPLNRLTALHQAYFTGGYFVYIPRGTVLEEPLAITQILSGEGLPHALIVVEEMAEVTFLETFLSAGPAGGRFNGALEVHAADGARVRFFGAQKLEDKALLFRQREAFLGRDSHFEWILGEVGARYDLVTNHTYLVGDGGVGDSIMVFVGGGRQQFHLDTQMIHVGAHTQSNMDTKGVLKDRSTAVYTAFTDIKRRAIGTRSWQSEKTLMLDPRARADLIPALWIDESDVIQAGHAATAGQVDPEQLYYLMSRGIPRSEALYLLVFGFLDPILRRIPLESVREDLLDAARRKIRS